MTLDDRMELAEQLRQVLSAKLAPEVFTGTGKDARERKQELARLMARVSAVVMYDGLPASEQAFRTKQLENEMERFAEETRHHAWQPGAGGGNG